MGELANIVEGERSGDLRRWILSRSPTGAETEFDLSIVVGDQRLGVSYNAPGLFAQRDLGCLQDMVLALMTMQLVAKGALSLIDEAGSFLPKIAKARGTDMPIRVNHLLSHSAGYWLPDLELIDRVPYWEQLCPWLEKNTPMFEPGLVLNYTHLERIILIAILKRFLGDGFLNHSGKNLLLDMSDLRFEDVQDKEGGEKSLFGSIAGLTDFLVANAPVEHALALPGGLVPIARQGCPKDWAPVSAGCGLLRFGNGTWGQNGTSPAGAVGVRLAPAAEISVAGWFRTAFLRDYILAAVVDDLAGHSRGCPDTVIGALSLDEAESWTGNFRGMLVPRLHLAVERSKLAITGLAGPTSKTTFDITPNGDLSARLGNVSLWMEGQRIESLSDAAIWRIGQNIFVKDH